MKCNIYNNLCFRPSNWTSTVYGRGMTLFQLPVGICEYTRAIVASKRCSRTKKESNKGWAFCKTLGHIWINKYKWCKCWKRTRGILSHCPTFSFHWLIAVFFTLRRCFLKLGEWQLSLQGINESTIPKVLQYYSHSTEHDRNWYKVSFHTSQDNQFRIQDNLIVLE